MQGKARSSSKAEARRIGTEFSFATDGTYDGKSHMDKSGKDGV